MLNSIRNPEICGGTGEVDIFTAIENCIHSQSVNDQLQPVEPSVVFAKMALAEGQVYLDALRTMVLRTADFFRCRDEVAANIHLVELVWGVEWFLKMAGAVGQILDLDYSRIEYEGKQLDRILRDLQEILKEMQSAHEQSDDDVLPDLLEYELAPQLECWRAIFSMIERQSHH